MRRALRSVCGGALGFGEEGGADGGVGASADEGLGEVGSGGDGVSGGEGAEDGVGGGPGDVGHGDADGGEGDGEVVEEAAVVPADEGDVGGDAEAEGEESLHEEGGEGVVGADPEREVAERGVGDGGLDGLLGEVRGGEDAVVDGVCPDGVEEALEPLVKSEAVDGGGEEGEKSKEFPR